MGDKAQKPKSRKSDLVIKKLKDETLIYDLSSDKVYCLNQTSSVVWDLCDGNRSVKNIADKMMQRFKKPVSEEVVKIALDQLSKDALIESPENQEPYFPKLSRREAIRMATGSLIALPVIYTLTAPLATMAQSGGLPLLSVCLVNSDCAPGLFCAFDSVGTTFDRHCCIPPSNGGIGPGQCVADANICTNNNSQLCCNHQGSSMVDPTCPASAPIRCLCL